MARTIIILLGLLLVASAAAVAIMRMPADRTDPPVVPTMTPVQPVPDISVQPAKRVRLSESRSPVTETRQVRQIAPQTIVAPQASDMTLVREEPRPPLSDLGQPRASHRGGSGKGTRLYRPVALSAGRIVAQGYHIRLSGIVPTSPNKTCQDANGADTPCGMRARTALRRFLRGRAIECDVPDRPAVDEIVAECRLAGKDIGDWLVEYGWALPDGDRYQAAAAKARKNRRGLLALGRAD